MVKAANGSVIAKNSSRDCSCWKKDASVARKGASVARCSCKLTVVLVFKIDLSPGSSDLFF